MSSSLNRRSSAPSESDTEGDDDEHDAGGGSGMSASPARSEPPLAPDSIRRDPSALPLGRPREGHRLAPLGLVRRAVSRRKRRFVEGEFDLDLSYITPRLLAMSYPSPTPPESLYRNPMGPTRRFLDGRHGSRYLVLNLAAERRYDASEFYGRVHEFPFDDHAPPPLDMMCALCATAVAHLGSDPSNALAVHCKAGKGRTGVMVCAVLLASRELDSARDALAWFGYARAHNGKGVTIPSQRRYVHYAERLLAASALIAPRAPPPPQLVLRQVCLSSAPAVMVPTSGLHLLIRPLRRYALPAAWPAADDRPVHVRRLEGAASGRAGGDGDAEQQLGAEWQLAARVDVALQGDVQVELFAGHPSTGGHRLLRFCVHTAFVPTSEPLVLPKAELDGAVKDKQCKHFPPGFRVLAQFGAASPS